MKSKETQTQKKTSACLVEVENETIKPIDLLQEIEPLLKEYFIGGFEIKDEKIILSFKNGQQFRLVIEEVC